MTPFNGLTPAEAERLAMLVEECGEVAQAAAKVLRHGYASQHPMGGPDNHENLLREVNDLAAVVGMMARAGDDISFDATLVGSATIRKLRFAHHQESSI